MKDVTLPDVPARRTLLLDKHADYIVAFEKDTDDLVCVYVYVCTYHFSCSLNPLPSSPSPSVPLLSLRTTALWSSCG